MKPSPRTATEPAARRASRRAPARRTALRRPTGGFFAPKRGDEGFILLESVLAISLITVLMGALANFTLSSLDATADFRARQGATQVATSAVAALTTLPADDVLTGHGTAAVTNQFNAARPPVTDWLATMNKATDDALSATTPTVPIAPTTQVLNNITYTVTTYLGTCYFADASAQDCVRAKPADALEQLRAVVSVTWSGSGCSGRPTPDEAASGLSVHTCSFITATLLSRAVDPVFAVNADLPPAPVVTNPGNRVSTQGATVSVQLTTDSGTGASPLAWDVTSGDLPLGLTLAKNGLISGIPTQEQVATPLTVTVKDAYGRTAGGTFTWRVVAPPSVTPPVNQTAVQGVKINALPITTTCPNPNGPCTVAVTGLPDGLTYNSSNGTITGTPTTDGTSTVTVIATDADSIKSAPTTFTWTVLPAATIGSPGALEAVTGTPVNVAVPYTCAAGPCTITLTKIPLGVGLSATANNTAPGGYTKSTLNVPTGSGSVYLTGVLQPGAVSAGLVSKNYTPTLTIADAGSTFVAPTPTPGNWTIYVPSAISGVGDRTVSTKRPVNVPLSYTCAKAPCTITLTNRSPGVGLSATGGATGANNTLTLTVTAGTGTVYLSGFTPRSAVPAGKRDEDYPVKVTLTDALAKSAASTGTWTASIRPTVGYTEATGSLQTGVPVTIPFSYDCPEDDCTVTASITGSGGLLPAFPQVLPNGNVLWLAPICIFACNVTIVLTATSASGGSVTTTYDIKVSVLGILTPGGFYLPFSSAPFADANGNPV